MEGIIANRFYGRGYVNIRQRIATSESTITDRRHSVLCTSVFNRVFHGYFSRISSIISGGSRRIPVAIRHFGSLVVSIQIVVDAVNLYFAVWQFRSFYTHNLFKIAPTTSSHIITYRFSMYVQRGLSPGTVENLIASIGSLLCIAIYIV